MMDTRIKMHRPDGSSELYTQPDQVDYYLEHGWVLSDTPVDAVKLNQEVTYDGEC